MKLELYVGDKITIDVKNLALPYSQLRAPPVWYSITLVSKKFFSFLKSIISDIQGKGFVAPLNSSSSPI
jgi:hypothetical protein